MIRVRIDLKGTGAKEKQCIVITNLLHEYNLILGKMRLDGDTFSIVVADCHHPFVCNSTTIQDLKERIRPLISVLGAEIDEKVFETVDGRFFCKKCYKPMEGWISVGKKYKDQGFVLEKARFICRDCGDSFPVGEVK